LQTGIPIRKLVFISSDSGSAQAFRPEEDGFAIYAASKAALNQSLRHMAAELERKGSETVVLALHPGEVKTDMANVDLGWEVPDQMEVGESVSKCIATIEARDQGDNGTFWTWDGKV
jgi:NAD(P)-dependent dehydrogenase (short-subunit alcohol dehydrogenase family)